jgi:hypothetical protein
MWRGGRLRESSEKDEGPVPADGTQDVPHNEIVVVAARHPRTKLGIGLRRMTVHTHLIDLRCSSLSSLL